MSFEDYKAEDFLTEQSFLNYCIGRKEEDVMFWRTWLHKNPHKEIEFKQAENLYSLVSGNISHNKFQLDEKYFRDELERYKSALKANRGRKSSVSPLRWVYASAAAAVVAGLLFFSGWLDAYFFSQSAEFKEISRAGERRTLELPDGSRVLLNSSSTITVAEGFNKKDRRITLEGEAFFDVAHLEDKPFFVHTDKMDVQVLGTVFNVRAYRHEQFAEAALVQGSVEVTLDNSSSEKIVLKPHEKVVVKESLKSGNDAMAFRIDSMSATNNDAAIAWTRDRLVFRDEQFGIIAASLERWFNVTIKFESEEVKNYRFTASFERKSIAQVLDALKLSRNFTYRKDKENLYIITE